MVIYDLQVTTTSGQEISLSEYENKVILVVNTASRCGFTGQFAQLESLYQQYKEDDFIVLGFPCNQFLKQEPGSNEEILSFCKINYGVTFPIFSKIDVNGKNESPLFTFLKQKQAGAIGSKIKWNFTKFLIDRKGDVIGRFPPNQEPNSLKSVIESLLY